MRGNGTPSQKLGLGTVQFGMNYGVSNKRGQVSGVELNNIMSVAKSTGINLFDTAPGYGDSETAISSYIQDENSNVVTKTPHFKGSKITKSDCIQFRKSFEASLINLQVNNVHAILAHRGADLLKPGGKGLWNELEILKAENKVDSIGVSVYTPEELIELLDRYNIDIVQLPLNLLDQRFVRTGLLKVLRNLGIEVHVRSAFLQGLLLMEPKVIPKYFTGLVPHIESMRKEVESTGSSMLSIALNLGLNLQEVDTVLVGVDSSDQLKQIVQAANSPVPDSFDWDRWAIDELCWIDPNNWKVN